MAGFSIDLPPGFRFHRTDEEIITHYLSPKAMDSSFTAAAIGEIDLNKCEPWDLPGKANMGGKEWYFFCHKDRKYPTGSLINRATEAGYWKATGKDKEIFRGKDVLVGMKKTLVFYIGRAPKGEKTNWVMNEFRIEGNLCTIHPRIAQDEWVVSRVFHKNMAEKKVPFDEIETINSVGKESVPDSPNMPVLLDATYFAIGNLGSSSYNMMLNVGEMDSSDKLSSNPPPYTTAVSLQFPTYLQELTGALVATDASGSGSALRRHCKAEQLSKQSTIVSASPDIGGMSTDLYTEISSEIGCSYNFQLGDHRTSADRIICLNNI